MGGVIFDVDPTGVTVKCFAGTTAENISQVDSFKFPKKVRANTGTFAGSGYCTGDHNFGGWVTTVPLTDTAPGRNERYCSLCGIVEAAVLCEHEFGEWEVVLEPTLTAKGMQERVCEICGFVDQEEIDMLTVTDEVFIFAEDTDSDLYGVDKDNEVFKSKNGAITAAALAALFEDEDMTVYDDKGKEVDDDDTIGTGYVVCSVVGGVEYELTIIVLGDVDGNGKVDAIDASMLLQHDAKLIELKDCFLTAAEIQESGKASAVDASLILQYDAKLISNFK